MKLSAVISTAIAAKRENFTTNLRRWKKIKEDESAVLINICEDLAPYIPERLKKPYDKIKVADRLEAAEVLATVFPEEERTRTLIRKIENWLREFGIALLVKRMPNLQSMKFWHIVGEAPPIAKTIIAHFIIWGIKDTEMLNGSCGPEMRTVH